MRELGLERRVTRHHGDAVSFEVILDCGLEQLERRRIERDLRLIEQPDGALRSEQARERKLALLSGGEQAGGKVGERCQTKRGEGAWNAATSLAEKVCPEGEVLADGEARLDAIEMADIVAELWKLDIGPWAIEAQPAARERKETCDLPEQARLARAVGAGDQQPFAGGKREAHVLEQDPAAALAADLMGGKAYAFGHLLRFCALGVIRREQHCIRRQISDIRTETCHN